MWFFPLPLSHHESDGSRGEYPYPAVKHEPRIQQLHDDLVDLGLHPSHLPVGVMLDQADDGSPTLDSRCIRCDRDRRLSARVRNTASDHSA